MIDKKNIVMKNWYRTDCENSDDISVKQAYELGFNRAYKLMQTLMYKIVKTTIDQQVSDDWWYGKLNVEETINALSDSFCMFNSRVKIFGAHAHQHLAFKLEYALDLNKLTHPCRELILESQVLNVRIHKSDEDDWDYDIEIVADVERDYYDYGKC